MSHLDDETIALRALGEHIGPDAEAHLRGCEACRAEVAALERVTVSARGGGAGTLERPAEHVWDRIAAELELTTEPGPAEPGPAEPDPAESAVPAGHDVPTAPPAGPARQPTVEAPVSGAAPGRPGARSEPSGFGATGEPSGAGGPGPGESAARPQTARPAGTPWWRRRTAWVAAASFLLGVGGTAVVTSLVGSQSDQAPVVATAVLEPLPGQRVTGTATVHEVDGRRVLQVDLNDPGESGYLEVWLLDADAQRLVSLGILSGAEGVFDIPDSLDLGEFPVVDVSDEPYDGNPAHSGDSIVRGKLA